MQKAVDVGSKKHSRQEATRAERTVETALRKEIFKKVEKIVVSSGFEVARGCGVKRGSYAYHPHVTDYIGIVNRAKPMPLISRLLRGSQRPQLLATLSYAPAEEKKWSLMFYGLMKHEPAAQSLNRLRDRVAAEIAANGPC